LGQSGIKSTITKAIYWPIVPALDDNVYDEDDDCGAIGAMDDWHRKAKYWEETCPSARLSTKNPK
jgi:hypothetical protein